MRTIARLIVSFTAWLALCRAGARAQAAAPAGTPQPIVPGLSPENARQPSSTDPIPAPFDVRGPSSYALSALAMPADAFAVDGLFASQAVVPQLALFDLERVDLRKGPQGTLSGRNASSGVIDVITAKPQHALGANLSLEGGSYWLKHATGAVNVPFGNELALRVAGNWIDRDGYFDDGSADAHSYAGRVRLLWEPLRKLSLIVSGDYAHQHGRGSGAVPHGPDRATGDPSSAPAGSVDAPGNLPSAWAGRDPWLGPCSAQVRAYEQARFAAIASDPAASPAMPARALGAQCDGHVDDTTYGAALDLAADLGIARAAALLGYRGIERAARNYFTPEYRDSRAHSDQLSAELRLASSDASRFHWSAGAFALRERQDYNADQQQPVSAAPGALSHATMDWPQIVDFTAAAFTQETLELLPVLRVRAGLRYSFERQQYEAGSFTLYPDPSAGADPSRALAAAPSSADLTSNALDVRAGLDFDVAPHSLLYADVSTGTHAGGLNPGASAGSYPASYRPERLTAYELGAQNRLFSGLLQLDVEAFYFRYADLQVVHFGSVNSGLADDPNTPRAEDAAYSLRTDNARRAHVFGAALDADLLVTANDLLLLSLLISASAYDQFAYSDATFGRALVDASGHALAGMPLVSASLAYQHTFRLGPAGSIVAGASSRVRSGASMFYVPTAGNHQSAYTQTDLTVSYEVLDGALSLTAYARNLEGFATLAEGSFDSPSTGVPFVLLNPPRTFGVVLSGRL